MDENKPRALSIEEGVLALRQSREDQAKAAAQEDAEPEAEEVLEDQPEVEETDESEPEDVEAEAEDDGEEPDDDAEDDPDGLYEVAGEQFTLSELREWKANGLRNADYTRKTQELAEGRKAFEAERQQWEAERETYAEQVEQQKAQLKEALATFAIEQDPEPSPEGLTWDDYTKRKSAWDKRQAKKRQAQSAFQALQQEQHQETLKRETARLMQHFPAWRDPAVFKTEAEEMVRLAENYGFTPVEMAGISDHRMFRVLNELRTLKAEAEKRKESEKTAAKKVGKAAKRLTPGAKSDPKNQTTKELRQKRDQLRKSGSAEDAVAFMQARRMAR